MTIPVEEKPTPRLAATPTNAGVAQMRYLFDGAASPVAGSKGVVDLTADDTATIGSKMYRIDFGADVRVVDLLHYLAQGAHVTRVLITVNAPSDSGAAWRFKNQTNIEPLEVDASAQLQWPEEDIVCIHAIAIVGLKSTATSCACTLWVGGVQ